MKQIKKWQEPIYAIGGFGPGFLYQIVLTYLLFYYRPAQQLVGKGAVILAFFFFKPYPLGKPAQAE